jgi:high affinity Mn2+ porin
MNVGAEQRDVGLSRYPPAEGVRGSQRAGNLAGGTESTDIGSNRLPPAERERSAPPPERQPRAPARPSEENDPSLPPLVPLPDRPGTEANNGTNGDRDRTPRPRTVVSRAETVFAGPDAGHGGLPQDLLASSSAGPPLFGASFLASDGSDAQPPRDPETPSDTGLSKTSGFAELVGGQPAQFGTASPDQPISRWRPSPFRRVASEWQYGGQEPVGAGVSRSLPLASEPGAQPAPAQPAPSRPTISQRQRFTGISRYPPAEGVRTEPSEAMARAMEPSWVSAHEQATVVSQVHNVFPSPYIGPNSLLPKEPASNSLTGTAFIAARLWESERHDTQLVFNPEIAGGNGFSHVMGIAAYPNGELTRVGVENPTPYIARLYIRQTFGFGGEREYASDDVNQVAGERDIRRLAVIVGKWAAPDIADDNRYAHDPRTQFLNWALVYNGAWDYPANVRGYTYGLALDYNHSKKLSFSYGLMAVPLVANGAPLDPHFLKAQGHVLEMENRYELFSRPGTLRLMTFLNHAHMGDYNEALQLMPVDPIIQKTRSYRYKYGFCLSADQELTDDIGIFSRLGWNDGHTESWAFTEIDRTASLGMVMGGRLWCRPFDQVGLAGVLDGISGPHRAYLEAGGLGFIIGDGKLRYGLEQVLEFYYDLQVRPGLVFTFDFQEVVNPAYNRDRGPVSIASIRVHWDR